MPQKNHPQKGFANMIVLIVFLLTMGGTVWYFKNFPLTQTPTGQSQIDTKSEPSIKPTEPIRIATTTTQSASIDTSSWKIYKNTKFGFSVKYPTNWHVMIDAEHNDDINPGEKIYHLIVASTDKLTHGTGDPLEGPWFMITKIVPDEFERCEKNDSGGEYFSYGDGEAKIGKIICKNHVSIDLVMWKNEVNNKEEYKNILDAIAESFRVSKN